MSNELFYVLYVVTWAAILWCALHRDRPGDEVPRTLELNGNIVILQATERMSEEQIGFLREYVDSLRVPAGYSFLIIPAALEIVGSLHTHSGSGIGRNTQAPSGWRFQPTSSSKGQIPPKPAPPMPGDLR